jgi:hypothetical protein
MDNIIEQVAAAEFPLAVQRALESYAREDLSKSMVLDIMNNTFLQTKQRDGINRWLNVIDDARVSGITPTPNRPQTRSVARNSVGPTDIARLDISVDVPAPRRSLSARGRGPRSRSSSSRRVSPRRDGGPLIRSTSVLNGDTSRGRPRTVSRSTSSSTDSRSSRLQRHAQHTKSSRSPSYSRSPSRNSSPRSVTPPYEGKGKQKRPQRSNRTDKDRRKEKKRAEKAKKKEALRRKEDQRRTERKARKKAKKAKSAKRKSKHSSKGRKKLKRALSSDSDGDSSLDDSIWESSSGSGSNSSSSESDYSDTDTSDSSSTSGSERSGRDRKHKSKYSMRFTPGKEKREWRRWSDTKRVKTTIKWKACVGNPKAWYEFYGRRLKLDRSLSMAHAWKLTQSFATDLQIFGCNLHITFAGKSTKELEDGVVATARRRIDYYAWRSAAEVALATWLALMPWLRRGITRYRRQLDAMWDELWEAFSPRTYMALQRIQAAHRYMMQALDMDPYLVIGNRRTFSKARLRFTSAYFNNASDIPFEPARWLEPEQQHLLNLTGQSAVGQRGAGGPANSGQGNGTGVTSGRNGRSLGATESGGTNPTQNVVQYCLNYNNNPAGCSHTNCKFVHRCATGKSEMHGCGTAGPLRECQWRPNEPRRANGNGRPPGNGGANGARGGAANNANHAPQANNERTG